MKPLFTDKRSIGNALSPGQDGNGPHGRKLLAEFEPEQIEHVLVDTAYDGDETRKQIKNLKAKACIKPHKNRTTKKRYDKDRYKNRNHVERFFGLGMPPKVGPAL
jgi:transposase